MFDAHTHLQDRRLRPSLTAVATAAFAAGVRTVVVCGTSPDDWQDVAALAATPPAGLTILPAFGVHPWFVERLPADWEEQLVALLQAHPAAAVGEIGLDGLRRDLDPQRQYAVFEAQLRVALELERPVNLHGARCWGRLAEALTPYATGLPGLILHAFAGAPELIPRFCQLGAHFSFGGALCNPQARRVRAVAAQVPLTRLLIETDSPDIFPPGGSPAPGSEPEQRLNHPANLLLVARTLAALRECSLTTIVEATAPPTSLLP